MTTTRARMRFGGLLLACACGFSSGCSSPESPQVTVQPDGIESLPPAQIQRALQQLSSGETRAQNSGLEFAEHFPSLVSTHRELIVNLSQNGATASIKKKANELLEPTE